MICSPPFVAHCLRSGVRPGVKGMMMMMLSQIRHPLDRAKGAKSRALWNLTKFCVAVVGDGEGVPWTMNPRKIVLVWPSAR